MTVSDEELALSLQHGNKAHLALLVERYYAPLLGYLYRLCGGYQPLAEDMVQETFLRVLRGIGLYHYPRPFKAWLYAIATNIARNHYDRADSRRTHVPINDEAFADTLPQPEEATLHQDEQQRVLDALHQLPDHQREVVVLFYYQELSQQDIADTLRIPLGTVKSRLSLGLKRLRSLLAEEMRS